MDNQRVNFRRRNLPAELKVEIVDCLPLENAVHFLANVPNRLIIRHCAPRLRRILKMISQIAADYARILPAMNSHRNILIQNWHQYTPEMDIFLRYGYGAAHCNWFVILRGTNHGGFVGYPANFFDDLIKYYYETKVPLKAVHRVNIALNNPVPWPTTLVQTQAGEMHVDVSEVSNFGDMIEYILRNKNNPGIAFKLSIYFEEDLDAICYQQMTRFVMMRVEDVQ